MQVLMALGAVQHMAPIFVSFEARVRWPGGLHQAT